MFSVPTKGVSYILKVSEGRVTFYASLLTTAPSEAFYQWKVDVSNSSQTINLLPQDFLSSQKNLTSVSVYTTLVGRDEVNSFCLSTSGKHCHTHLQAPLDLYTHHCIRSFITFCTYRSTPSRRGYQWSYRHQCPCTSESGYFGSHTSGGGHHYYLSLFCDHLSRGGWSMLSSSQTDHRRDRSRKNQE